jgi:hypothetical protein
MITNAFIGKSTQPTERELAAELGPSKTLWKHLLNDLASEFDLTDLVWHTYSTKAGWSLRVRRRERNIVYLAPSKDSFMACLALGDKALQSVRRNKLPKRIMKLIDEAKRYPEGTAIRIEVTSPKDLDIVKKFINAKLEN